MICFLTCCTSHGPYGQKGVVSSIFTSAGVLSKSTLRNRPNVSDSAEAIMQTEQAKRDSYAIELGIIQDMFEAGTINRTQMRQLRRNVYVMQVDAESEL